MSFRSAASHLQDILSSIEWIELFLGEMTLDEHRVDQKTKSAVERELQKITEAAHRLGPEADTVCPGPAWKRYLGMGNILRHAYDGIDDEIVWDTLKVDLPSLKEAILRAIPKLSPPLC